MKITIEVDNNKITEQDAEILSAIAEQGYPQQEEPEEEPEQEEEPEEPEEPEEIPPMPPRKKKKPKPTPEDLELEDEFGEEIED